MLRASPAPESGSSTSARLSPSGRFSCCLYLPVSGKEHGPCRVEVTPVPRDGTRIDVYTSLA
jgi:hypothetical protein